MFLDDAKLPRKVVQKSSHAKTTRGTLKTYLCRIILENWLNTNKCLVNRFGDSMIRNGDESR